MGIVFALSSLLSLKLLQFFFSSCKVNLMKASIGRLGAHVEDPGRNFLCIDFYT
ncbi:hypothetical protein KI387_006402, partial [Taxus chinensis]